MGEWHELTIKTSEENMEKEEDDKNDEKQYAAHHHLLALRTRSMTNPRLLLTMVASGLWSHGFCLRCFLLRGFYGFPHGSGSGGRARGGNDGSLKWWLGWPPGQLRAFPPCAPVTSTPATVTRPGIHHQILTEQPSKVPGSCELRQKLGNSQTNNRSISCLVIDSANKSRELVNINGMTKYVTKRHKA